MSRDRKNNNLSKIKEGYSGRSEQMDYLTVPSYEPYWMLHDLGFYDPFRYEQEYIPRYNWLFPNEYYVYNKIY